jgi:transposase
LSAPAAALPPESSAASGSALDLGITTRLARGEAGTVLRIGVDAHKRVHAAVALDAFGREAGRRRVANSAAGWRELLAWAAAVGGSDTPRRWGIEGAWGYGRGLAQHLVAAGETVSEVSPRWTAAARKSARTPGKSDPLDATAVARLVLQEGTALPAVAAEDETAVLDLLTTERDAALADATRLRNQLHHLLLQLDPEYEARLPALRTAAGLAALEGYAAPGPRALDQERAASVRRLAQRLRLAVDQAAALAAQIRARAQAGFVALTRLCGVSLLTAGALAGILGPGRRFATDAQLAAFAGVAPLEASSAGRVRHRLNRGGNRRLNAILYRIAVTQAGASPQAKAYLARRTAEGKSRREALRALKRHLVRRVWRLWQECHPVPGDTAAPALPAAA